LFISDIFTFMLADFLQMAVASCMVHQILPRNFTLPCMLSNETFLSPSSAGVVEGQSSLTRASETKPSLLTNEESFLCCLWSDNDIDCSLYRASMPERKFLPSEISISASQETDSNWNIECWIKGKLDLLVCSLRFLKLYLRADLKVDLLYAVSELSLGAVSTSSLKGTVMVAECDCGEYKCECCVPSLRLNYTYIMWLRTMMGVTPLWSPLMSVKPIDIVKPEPPLNLHLEMTEKGQVKIGWSNAVPMPYPLQYEVKISANSGESGRQTVQVALETSLAVDDTLLDSSYLVEVRCRNHGPGFWSDWSAPYNLNLGAEVLYFPPKILTSVGSNVSFHCIYKNKTKIVTSKKIVWWLNLAEEIPESQYTLVNDRVSKVTLFNLKATKPRGSFFYNALYCCHQNRECHHRYAELYVVDVNISITCETDGYLTRMTCRWSANPNTLLLGSSLQLRYYRSKIYCSDFPSTSPKSEVKECHLQRNHSYECTFQPVFLLSGYTMWIEFKHVLGTLESSPTCVVPAYVVKPLPPSNVKAEITRNVGLLNVSWTNPVFANNDLKFQIRYAVNREEITWELYEVSKAPTRSAAIKVQQLCVEYVVQVRCRELDGSGYWSNWSGAAYTLVRDIKAPSQGPEFWRIIVEDPARRQKNVTLLWKPLMKNHSLCSVSQYVIKHQTSGNTTWSDYVANGTTCSFLWTEHTHTVTVLAMNSIGVSSINFNLTLSQQMSTVTAVQSLSAYPVNSTCVILIWTLSPQIYAITSFIIEWKNLNKEEEMKWVRVPPNTRKYYIYDHFILIEKYQFSVYPVFAGGVGKSRATDRFTKGEYENENNASLYVVLPIVVSTSVLLLGALLVSHQRRVKLFWEDVPNPKNCSWAQGVNFQKPETFEHLFVKHPEAMSFEPLLLEPEIVLEDISVTKALKKEDTQDFLVIDSMFTKIQDSERDSACSSSHFNSSSFSESSHDEQISGEITRQSDIKYATVINNSRSSGLYEQKMNPRSCFDRCFLAEDSLVTGAWEVENGPFLALPDPPGGQPCKTLSLSLISSEGFSEPSDQDDTFTDGDSPERSLYYLGITSLEKRENDIFLTESSRVMCQFHTNELLKDVGFLQHAPPNLNTFIQSSLEYKAIVPYVPQFQMPAAEVQETTEKNS
ncbi:LEPR protein, partial [Podilymbus podiceps]|nr:LEPR protein [Podilymbus podiceps]